jgi:hypothetical protein
LRWSQEKANDWFKNLPWMAGCNFIPSTAINQLEMWQAESFDPTTIDRELGWAAGLGMKLIRVYLHDLLWAEGGPFLKRIDQFLGIAKKHGILTLFVLFDDCWNGEFKLGRQPEPKPGIHNSGWVQSPGVKLVEAAGEYPRLKSYVQGVLKAFKDDPRVFGWDLYNEPGNAKSGDKSAALLKSAFEWSWEILPSQPLISGIWNEFAEINRLQRELPDIISFHNYNDAADLEKFIPPLREFGRPVICTEYMARTRNSRFETHLPIFKRENISCINWGLVAGKTNTIYAWDTPETAEPKVWFHDIFRPDGSPYSESEVKSIRQLLKGEKA